MGSDETDALPALLMIGEESMRGLTARLEDFKTRISDLERVIHTQKVKVAPVPQIEFPLELPPELRPVCNDSEIFENEA